MAAPPENPENIVPDLSQKGKVFEVQKGGTHRSDLRFSASNSPKASVNSGLSFSSQIKHIFAHVD